MLLKRACNVWLAITLKPLSPGCVATAAVTVVITLLSPSRISAPTDDWKPDTGYTLFTPYNNGANIGVIFALL